MSFFNDVVRELGSKVDIGWFEGFGSTAIGTGFGFMARAGWILGYFSCLFWSLFAAGAIGIEPDMDEDGVLGDMAHQHRWI